MLVREPMDVRLVIVAVVLLMPGCLRGQTTAPKGSRGASHLGAWREPLTVVPPDAESIAGWDLTEFDAEVDGGAFPRLPRRVDDDLWRDCQALRGRATRVVRWSGAFVTGTAVAGVGVGREAHARCTLGGRPEQWQVSGEASSSGLVIVDASGEPVVFAPSEDLVVFAFFDDRFEPRTNAQKLALITQRRETVGASLSQRLQDIDPSDVTWSVDDDDVEPTGRQLAHHRTSEARTFRSGTRVVGRATVRFATAQIAQLHARRTQRTLQLFRRWESDNPPRPQVASVVMARPSTAPRRRLDTSRIRVSVRDRAVVIAASLPHGQRAAFERLLRIPSSTTLDAQTPEAEDREIRIEIDRNFGEHYCRG